MGTNTNNDPLYKRVHWRRFRNMAAIYCTKMEDDIDMSKYDFNHVCCYSCIGSELQGSNVIVTNVTKHCTPWVSDNHYDVYEVPETTNYTIYNTNFVGSYLFFAHDKDFDYWVVSKMIYTVDQSKAKGYNSFTDSVNFIVYGKYDISMDTENIIMKKTALGKDCTFGGNSFEGKFDSVGNRKHAYGKSARDYLTTASGFMHDPNNIGDSKQVQVYKKKSSNR